jgi:hypothetical protein
MESRQALARLQQRLRDQCPDEHVYAQPGLGMPPWCEYAASSIAACTEASTVRDSDRAEWAYAPTFHQ